MEKLDGKTKDLVRENISEIRRLFPSCVKEGKVDFDALRTLLDKEGIVSEDKEKYSFTWYGKNQAKRISLQQNSGTLRPVKSESVDFDNTKNMIIEGDNLEVLRLLLKPYSGKVKMIYIDPPYNTGNDFVYKDDFSDNLKNYVEKSGQALVSNPETNGRHHSDWLSMMYPRLSIARNLLTEDGAIFVSIDDNEIQNLRIMMDEIFGEENFVSQMVWKKKSNPPNNVEIGTIHEYVVVYVKDILQSKFNLLDRSEELNANYTNPDNDPRGSWMAGDLSAAAKGGRSTPSLLYDIINPNTGETHSPPPGRMWIVPKDVMERNIKEGRVWWGSDKKGKPKYKRFLKEVRQGVAIASILSEDVGTNGTAARELSELFEGKLVFETPKPVQLIQQFVKIATPANGSYILDFFAGSGTTAQSVLTQNLIDGGRRKFIIVQLPELMDKNSEAYHSGFTNLSEVCKERVRRAIKKIKEEQKQSKLESKSLDLGFKVFKLDSTNILPWNPDPKHIQTTLEKSEHNLKSDRSDEDILYEIMLKYGVDLTESIKEEKIDGKTIYNVGEGYLYVCLDKNLSKQVIEHIAKSVKDAKAEKGRVVFGDACFKDDKDAVNAELVLKKTGIEDIRRL